MLRPHQQLIRRARGWAALAVGLLSASFFGCAFADDNDLPGGPDQHVAQYFSHKWQMEDGLPGNYIQAIAQTPDGYLWVGTRQGLARFNSLSFTTFDFSNTPELKSSFISALCVDRHGTLWIGTSGGLVRYENGIFTRFTKTNGLVGNYVSTIIEGRDGVLWIGTTVGITRWKDGNCENFTLKDGLISGIIRALLEDRNGSLWIATGEGLNCLSGKVMKKYTVTNGLPENSLRCLREDKTGRIWLGSNNGIICYDAGKFRVYNKQQGLSDNFVSSIFEDRDGNFWVGTYSGLNRFRDGQFFNEPDAQGMAYDQVNGLMQDHEGNLWIGSREGLVRLSPKRIFTYTTRQGLSHNNIMSVMEDHNGSLWLGTWGGGLDEIKDGNISVYAPSNGFFHDLVLSTCEGRDGSLWIGADYDGGITRMLNGQYTRYTKKQGLISSGVKVIYEDRSGTVWAGTGRGLNCLKDGKISNYTTTNGLVGNFVKVIHQDFAGDLWIGTESGLSLWKDGRFINYTSRNGLCDDAVMAIYEDAERNLWIGTLGGLNRYKDGKFTSYTGKQGLGADDVYEILEDDHGWFWMSSDAGIFRVRKHDFDDLDEKRIAAVASIRYGKADGIESSCFNTVAQPSGWKTRDGRLWFATTKGVVAIASDIPINQQPPPVFVEELMADKKAVWPSGRARNTGADQINVPPGRGELDFQYAALNFQMPEKTRFKYRLDGADSEWVDADIRREAHYNNLYPGSYSFNVIACNNDGVWNTTGATLAVIILPHFWQTLWFRGLVLLTAVALVAGVVRYVTHARMQRRLELLEQQHGIERERRRIAEDIHDDLGGSLTQITLLGELAMRDMANPRHAAGHIGKITESARQTVRALDEIVWAVHPGNDTVDHLALYLWQYAEEFSSHAAIRCRVDAPPDLPHHPLSADVRHNIFLVVKEAFNNTSKHAAATEMWLRIGLDAAGLAIEIEDNGGGFDAAANSPGNGLRNMKKRIEAIGGRIEITSRPGHGARIKFVVPLQTTNAN